MKIVISQEKGEFRPITVSLTFETGEQLREFLEQCERPFLDLGYDDLYDTVKLLEEYYLLWRRAQT